MSPAQKRRRLSPESDPDAEGRRGCITVGAVLGVLLGIVLGLFVLPTVLDSFLAGEEVDVGSSYSAGARVISVASVSTGDGAVTRDDGSVTAGTRIDLNVLSRKTWLIEPEFFQLELSAGGDWLNALDAVPSIPESSLDFGLGESRILVIQFEHGASEGEPRFLHLSDPSIRLKLASPAK